MMLLNDLLLSITTLQFERDLAFIDRVKAKFQLKSDRELAQMIGTHKTVLSEMRGYARTHALGTLPPDKAPRLLTALQRLRV